MGHDILIRSTRKLIVHNKIQQSGMNITRLRTSGGRSNWSANKSIVVGIREITQLGVLLSHCDYATRLHSKTDLTRKRRTKKRANKTTNFCEVGERKTRGKWQIM